jgi:hypothetical protein
MKLPLKNLVYLICIIPLYTSSFASAKCDDLLTYYTNYSDTVWHYDSNASYAVGVGDDSHLDDGDYTELMSELSAAKTINPGETVMIQYRNEREDHQLDVYTTYYSDDGRKVQLHSERDKNTHGGTGHIDDPQCTVHTDTHADIDFMESAQTTDTQRGTCRNHTGGCSTNNHKDDKVSSVNFSLLDVPKQKATIAIKLNSNNQAATVGQQSYSTINAEYVDMLDQVYSKPLELKISDDTATFIFNLACTPELYTQQESECLVELENDPSSECASKYCYYYPSN